ncbi:MAG: hypothetical protein ACYDA5_00540 [Vulcanimicrobiaceae bacterium]
MTLLVCLAFLTTIVSCIVVWIGVIYASQLSSVYLATVALSLATIYGAILIWQPRILLLTDVLILAVAVFAGSFLGRQLRNTVTLVVFAVSASVADFVSFNWGLTRALIHASHPGASGLLEYLSLTILLPGGGAQPILGIADLLMLAAFMGSMHQLGYRRAALIVPASGLAIALAISFAVGGIYAVPFMVAAVVAYLLLAQLMKVRRV